jgi:hypothetical protein
MKYAKMLGVLAVAVTAPVAFVITSVASATVLCTTNPTAGQEEITGTHCPSGQAYGTEVTGVEIHAVNVGDVDLDTGFGGITCSRSTVQGETSAENGSPLSGPVGLLTFGECGNCAAIVLDAGTLTISWIFDTHNGTVTSEGAEITTGCTVLGLPIHCTYVTNDTDIGTLTGGNPATFIASAHIAVDEANSDGVCPEESTFTATYKVTTPKPLYVAGHT